MFIISFAKLLIFFELAKFIFILVVKMRVVEGGVMRVLGIVVVDILVVMVKDMIIKGEAGGLALDCVRY